MTVSEFIKELIGTSFENTFNPYVDHCEIYDYMNSAGKRKILLKKILIEAKKKDVDAIWLGRDLGYRGGRRTGLALTDDVHLFAHAKRWGVETEKMTKGTDVSERTATVIWECLENLPENIFLWNVFPLHPYYKEKPFSNRPHNSGERDWGVEILKALIDLIKPKKIIAIGNDAEKVASNFINICDVIKVRHPSYGGHNIFREQIAQVYEVSSVLGPY